MRIRRPKGFSLLEILVAFAIMAVALTIVLRIFGTGVRASLLSEDYVLAVQIAESLMARSGVETPLELGETRGEEGDKYSWLVRVSRFAADSAVPAGQGDIESGLQLVAVSVRVGWGDNPDKQRWLELNSLKLIRESAW